jgi:ectoine hydroxylase-related dioxygenase (phytanoyl-CoA dioxygenase family)
MRPFRELQARDLNSGNLQSEIGSRGYVLVRNVLPRDEVNKVLGSVAQVVSAAGWLLPGNDPSQRMANVEAACGDPDPIFKRTYQEVFGLAGFHALPHHPELKRVMRMLVGNRLLVHPKPIGRLIFPNCEKLTVHAHQDYRFMGGDPECFTAWIPLHDCPIEAGPLQIMEGSHQFGFQNHEDENLHVPEIPAGSAVGGEWVGGEIRAGDVLIFHSLTVHAAAPNRSKQLRISIDCRFQDYSRVINPSNLAFAGESGKSWEKVYSSWPCDDLKFYWKELPLNLKPSIAELEELSVNADSPAMRSRYARILSQVH